jgi:hypothetical protein
MKSKWIVLAAVASAMVLSFAAADPALARKAKPARSACADRPVQLNNYTFHDFIFGRPAPQPNGCSPAVYQYGKFVGQDPDPNIRAQLSRDPYTGYQPY